MTALVLRCKNCKRTVEYDLSVSKGHGVTPRVPTRDTIDSSVFCPFWRRDRHVPEIVDEPTTEDASA